MQKCMELALKDAGITPDKVGYVSGHGRRPKKGDIAETLATEAVFGFIPMSSQKKLSRPYTRRVWRVGSLVYHRNDEQRLVCADC